MAEVSQRLIEERLVDEILNWAFNVVRKDALSSLLTPATVIVVMWSEISHGTLIAWAVLMALGIGAKYAIAQSYFRRDVPYTDAKKWGRLLAVNSLYLGLLWSASIFLFYVEGSVAHQVFMYVLGVVLSFGSILAGLYWLPRFYFYGPPILAAVAIRLAMDGSLANTALAVLVVWAVAASIRFARMLHEIVHSELRLRVESSLLNEELEVKKAQAEKATLEKARFLAAASHDLRQPLHSLSLFVDVLKDAETERERRALFPRINRSLEALRKLFDALLDISRLDANVVKPECTHFDLAEVLNRLAEEFRPSAEAKNLKLKVHARPVTVNSDRLLLERVIRNLLSNAIRYTESGGVLLSCRRRAGEVLLQVWDTGIGIPEDSRDEVFAEFYQLHNSHRDRSEGVGLGLALTKRLCALTEQPIRLDSRPGRGTVFSIRIAPGSRSLVAGRQATTAGRRWDLTGRRVLVIDDEKDILQAMEALLSKWGCEVVAAESMEQAVNELRKRNAAPDLLVSDLRLPGGKTGIEVLNILRNEFGTSIPGILISGDTDPEQLAMAKKSDYELLQKPVRPLHLRTLIQRHLSALNA